MIYEGMRTWFTAEGSTDPGPWAKLASGASSGAIAQTITYPLFALPPFVWFVSQLICYPVTFSVEDSKSIPWLVWATITLPFLAP
jgi:hypothetical protein